MSKLINRIRWGIGGLICKVLGHEQPWYQDVLEPDEDGYWCHRCLERISWK